jgi:hypothetical protein
MFVAHLFFQLIHTPAFKLDYLAAAQALQVIVLPGGPLLIVVVFFIEVELVDKAQTLEEPQAPVDGGQAQAGVSLLGQGIELMGIKVPPPSMDQLQEDGPLRGDPLAVFPQNPPNSALVPGAHDRWNLLRMLIVCISI